VGGKIAGVILNGFNARKAGYSRGTYSSYYYYRDRGGYGEYGTGDGEGEPNDDRGEPQS
jgi:hypothetical protein